VLAAYRRVRLTLIRLQREQRDCTDGKSTEEIAEQVRLQEKVHSSSRFSFPLTVVRGCGVPGYIGMPNWGVRLANQAERGMVLLGWQQLRLNRLYPL
jgi:hypothetical protein